MQIIKTINYYLGLTLIAFLASSPVHAVITDLAEDLLGISSELKEQLLRLPAEMQWEVIAQITDIPVLDEFKIVRLQHILTGHTGHVRSAQFSPDGRHIVTASFDNTARIWNTATGALEHTLAGHTNHVISAAYSSDGNHIVTSSRDKTTCMWNALTGDFEHTIIERSLEARPVFSVAFSPDGRHIATVSGDFDLSLWNAHTRALEHGRLYRGLVSGAVFSPDSQHIVTVSCPPIICNASTGVREIMLEGHSDQVNSVAYNSTGTRIVTGADDGIVRIYNAETGALKRRIIGVQQPVRCVAMSPDDRYIIIVSSDGAARILNIATHAIEYKFAGTIKFATFSPDGKHIVTLSDGYTADDNTACIWEIQQGASSRLKNKTLTLDQLLFINLCHTCYQSRREAGLRHAVLLRNIVQAINEKTGKETLTIDEMRNILNSFTLDRAYIIKKFRIFDADDSEAGPSGENATSTEPQQEGSAGAGAGAQ